MSSGGIARALTYLKSVQQTDGSIASASTSDAALILGALVSVPEAANVCKPLASWLLRQKNEQWVFGDGLDVTFQALAALWLYDVHLVGPEVLGAAVHLLVAAEDAVGGPYRTRAAEPEIDLATNSCIAYFLKLTGSTLPPLQTYIQSCAIKKRWHSRRYPVDMVRYFVARVSADAPFSVLQRVQAQPNGSWLIPGVEQMHPAVITALAVEALVARRAAAATAEAPTVDDPRAVRLTQAIHDTAQADCEPLGPELRRLARGLLSQIEHFENAGEIMLLSYWFAGSLTKKPQIDDGVYTALGLANLYGWLAYTIFDDFLDDEGQPAQLPVATFALRRSIYYFGQALPGDADFFIYMSRAFDTIDAANAWELAHCRFAVDDGTITIAPLPRYTTAKRLYERSVAHTLPALAALVAAGYPLSSKPAREIDRAIRYYLAARQLIDDMRDWEEDVRRGQINYAVAAILGDMSITAGAQPLDSLVLRMQSVFWDRTLLQLSDVVAGYIATGRTALKRSGIVGTGGITQLFDGLEYTLEHTRQEQRAGEDFMAGFQGNS